MTTKRTNGPCTCAKSAIPSLEGHQSDCPSLYPVQQEPDALTRLVRVVRQMQEEQLQRRTDALADQALALISEAREEQRKALMRARNQGLETAAAHFYVAARRMSQREDAESRGDGAALYEYAETIRALKDPE